MSRLLYVTNNNQGRSIGGREQLSRLHSAALLELFGDRFERLELIESGGLSRVFGYINGVSHASIEYVCTQIKRFGAEKVFLDGSNLGRLAEGIAKRCSDVEISTFFHNCEARFFLGALRQHPSLRAAGVLMANYIAERNAVRFSDKLICLSERDSRQLRRLYGRSGTHILPMAMQDQLPKDLPEMLPPKPGKYALFVGGTFYANRQGIEWFVDHVAPRAPIKTYVVGKGFEQWKGKLERKGNVEVVGSVDSLLPWYLGAQVVIAPIFDGSGMKTKVAEALMFGKRVIGTPEAFSGYEDIAARVGTCCESPDEFVAALVTEAQRAHAGVNRSLREIYEQHYSFKAACQRLEEILS